MRYSLLLLLSFVLVIASCKKLEVPKSKQEMLRDANWKVANATLEYKLHNYGPKYYDLNYKFDLFADIDTVVYWRYYPNPPETPDSLYFVHKRIDPLCTSDDLFAFRDGNLGAYIPGEMLCSINETSELEFDWGITDNDTKMYIYDAKEFFRVDVNADLLEFYEDKFIIRYYDYKDRQIDLPGKQPEWTRDTLVYTMEFRKI